MSELVVIENVSLDGVMQAPGRTDEDPRGGFRHGGWAVERLSRDPAAMQAAMSGRGTTEALLFGRYTYLDLVGHWLAAGPNPFAEILTRTPKYVASTTLTEPLPHPNSHLLESDVVGSVRRLKEEGSGDLVVLGSGSLVRQLAAAGLVDTYRLTILPVVLGSGSRLFGDTFTDFEVVDSTTTATGITVATYRVVRP